MNFNSIVRLFNYIILITIKKKTKIYLRQVIFLFYIKGKIYDKFFAHGTLYYHKTRLIKRHPIELG